MKHSFLVSACIFCTVIPSSSLLAKQEQNGHSNTQAEQLLAEPEQSGERPDEITYHFHLASESYADKDLRTSAAQIRKAIEILKKQLSSGDHESRPLFSSSIVEMEMMAEKVEHGNVSSEKQLDKVFARAEVALAKHHIIRAQEAWEKERQLSAAVEISTSAINLENAMARIGYSDDGSMVNSVTEGRQLLVRLFQGLPVASKEINKAIIEMSVAIGKFEILASSNQE